MCAISAQALAQDSTKKSTLTLAAIYGNTANYYGQSTVEKLPYLLSYGGYSLKSGFYISAAALKLLNYGSGISAIDVSSGFNFDVTKNFVADLSYTRSFYQKDSPLLQTSNENTISAGLNYDFSLWETGVTADYAFGTENDLFVTFRNSRFIVLGSLFSEKDYISLEPSVDIIGGSSHYYETYTVEKKRRQGLLDPILPNPNANPNSRTETKTVETTSFDIMTYSVSLPVAYNRANYSLEASYQASILGKKFAEGSNKPRSFLNLSVYYQF